MIVLDMDGVMTDGRVHLDAQGVESKAFFIRYGFGIFLARKVGIDFAIITGVTSPIVERRAAYLGIDEVHQGHVDKDATLKGIMERRALDRSQVAYIGDDLFDLPALRLAGLSAAPADAHPDVLAEVDWVSKYPGGRGAVRELIELVLKAGGRWDTAMQTYTQGWKR
jgi:3-deoxy-D-manno-octulosonate 8-phosphate phosphatase (KDO 8-P phosphatase)